MEQTITTTTTEDTGNQVALDAALVSRNSDGSISVAGPLPQWFIEQFSELLDRTYNTLSVPEFSVIDSFLNDDNSENQSIRFEETLSSGGLIRGVITRCPDGLFAINQTGKVDGHEAGEIQAIREAALRKTNFGEVKHRRKEAMNFHRQIDPSLAASILPIAVSSVRDAMVVLDVEGGLIAANDPARELFPNLIDSDSSPISKATWEKMSSIAISKEQLKKVSEQVRKGIEEPLHTALELPLPIRQTWDVHIFPVHSPNGIFSGSVWSLQKQQGGGTRDFLDQISQAEKLEVVGRLAGGVAHDFNNLLAIVMGNISLLTEAAHDTGNQCISETAALAMEAAEKAAGMVRQLLGFSRKSRLEREITEFDNILTETAGLFLSTAGPGLQLHLDLKTELWKINGDVGKLGQVFLNIFENASQAMNGCGEINVTARTFVLDNPDMATAMECDQGHYLVINISDNGPGMPEEIREKVFEPFFTTKEVGKGTGLGLANALGIVQQHGGHISCTSIADEGTAFTIYLPREREQLNRRNSSIESASREKRLDRAATKSDEPAILVVDDEEMLRNVVRTMLHKHKYRTIAAHNGKNALELIEEREDEIAAIVLDLAMPEMSGNELFKELNSRGINIPVIVASGYLVDTEKFIRDAGGAPAGFLSKPYQLDELLSKVSAQYSPTARDEDGLALPG